MKRITQSLFEEIQKVSSGQIEEKLKHDEDGDGDEDAADYMMKRRKAGGQSHAQAHAATRKHNEEAEQEDAENVEQIDEISIETMKSAKEKLGNKAFNAHYDDNKRMAQNYAQRAMSMKSRIAKKQREMGSEKTNEEAEIEEAWPGTPEHKAKYGTDYEKHMMNYGGDPNAPRAKKGRYGNLGPSGSETEEKPVKTDKPTGRGRKPGGSKLNKMKEETIIKHEDFSIDIIDNPTFKDFLDAARSYVVDADDAVIVAEAFHTNDDISIIIENDIRNIYKDTLDKYEKEGYIIEDFDIILDEDEAQLMYSLVKEDSETRRNYIHHGKVVVEQKGE